MNRADFMNRLTELLADVSSAEREEAIQYYNDYFDDAGVENEQSVIASLGSPEQLAGSIKTGIADGGNVGEFTEKGFSGYEQKSSDEVMNINQTSEGKHEWNSNSGQNGNTDWRQENKQTNSNYNQFNGQNNYDGYHNSHEDNRNTSQPRNRMSGGMIALIVVLCILASPFLLAIGTGILGVVIGILGAVFGIVVGFGAAAISLMIVGVCLFVYGIMLLFGMPLGGLAVMGVGMICAAIGLFFLWITVIICGMLIPAIIRGIVKLFRNLFNKGGAAA